MGPEHYQLTPVKTMQSKLIKLHHVDKVTIEMEHPKDDHDMAQLEDDNGPDSMVSTTLSVTKRLMTKKVITSSSCSLIVVAPLL